MPGPSCIPPFAQPTFDVEDLVVGPRHMAQGMMSALTTPARRWFTLAGFAEVRAPGRLAAMLKRCAP